jgi:hypothetical protein
MMDLRPLPELEPADALNDGRRASERAAFAALARLLDYDGYVVTSVPLSRVGVSRSRTEMVQWYALDLHGEPSQLVHHAPLCQN